MTDGSQSKGHSVSLVEVSPRDGLQNDSMVSTEDKLELVARAVAAGVRRIEVTSFVRPDKVPQLADADEVVARLPAAPGVVYSALVLNERGFDRALGAGLRDINFTLAASEQFNRRNQGASVSNSLAEAMRLARRARTEGIDFTVTLATAFGCPFEGEVDAQRVLDIATELLAAEPAEIALADTIGVACPAQVTDLLGGLRQRSAEVRMRCHFHNTRNTGIANAYAAMMTGPVVLDASIGGTGGCPFAPNATGNIPTEDLIYMLQRMGHEVQVSLPALISCAAWLRDTLGHELPGLLGRAGIFPDMVVARMREQTTEGR